MSRRLTPDNLHALPARITRDGSVVSALFGPGSGALSDGTSICLGLHDGGDDWSLPGAQAPDGSFALFRAGPEHIELVADSVASRTIWYSLTDDLFLASSSQRALVSLLGNFELDRNAAAWMLSSGTLGPGHAWDVRLRQVPPGGRVTLDRSRWRLREHVAVPRFEVRRLAPAQHRHNIEAAVEDAVRRLKIDPSSWVLPLSGGVDSRGLLLAYRRATQDAGRLKCVTWGRLASLREPHSDAWVARRIARRFEVEHRFVGIDLSTEGRDTLIRRFLTAGEGRVASISGYLDGFELWRGLRDDGVEGVIRGDEAFGWNSVWTARAARHSTMLTTLEDFFSANVCSFLGLPPQRVPGALFRQVGESVATWRDRLYQQFRLPVVLAALTDLKSAYVEVVNPLLCESVLKHVRYLPDGLRTDKRLWRQIVDAWAPGMGSARSVSILPLASFLRDEAMRELLCDELASAAAEDALGPECCAVVRAGVEAQAAQPKRFMPTASAPSRVKSLTASKIRGVARRLRAGRNVMDPLLFAFRALIVVRMNALLRADAAMLNDYPRESTPSYV